MNNRKIIKCICTLVLKYLNNKQGLKNIDDFDLANLHIEKEILKNKYEFYLNYNNFDMFLFKKDDKVMLSVFDNNDMNNIVFINRLNLFYKICYKLFINVDFYKYFLKKENTSYYFLIDLNKTKISSVLLNHGYLEGDDLILFSMETHLLKEDNLLKEIV